ncbi:MAG: type II toxin-antitoxin system PemK/MazF family toxin [Acidimicrobiia bacterium]
MRRGEIVWADLDPVRGNEANKRRPVVIVSNDGANREADQLGRGVITVVPISSNVRRVYPFQVLVPAARGPLRRDAKVQAEQIRSLSMERIGKSVGRLPADLLAEVDDAVRLHLAL